jgi:hypothetical protein
LLGNRLAHQCAEFFKVPRSYFTGDGFKLPADVAGYRSVFGIEYPAFARTASV